MNVVCYDYQRSACGTPVFACQCTEPPTLICKDHVADHQLKKSHIPHLMRVIDVLGENLDYERYRVIDLQEKTKEAIQAMCREAQSAIYEETENVVQDIEKTRERLKNSIDAVSNQKIEILRADYWQRFLELEEIGNEAEREDITWGRQILLNHYEEHSVETIKQAIWYEFPKTNASNVTEDAIQNMFDFKIQLKIEGWEAFKVVAEPPPEEVKQEETPPIDVVADEAANAVVDDANCQDPAAEQQAPAQMPVEVPDLPPAQDQPAAEQQAPAEVPVEVPDPPPAQDQPAADQAPVVNAQQVVAV